MKKIVILSDRLPYPPISGTKNLLFNYCKILHEKLGMEVINISFLEHGDDISKKPDFISRSYSLSNPSVKVKVKNLLVKTLIQRIYPIQVSLFWDSKIKIEIDRILEKEKPQFVVSDLIRTTEYLKDYNGFKIADLQDLLSLRYEKQLLVNIKTINPYGAYLFRLPAIIQRLLQLAFVKRVVMRIEIRLLQKFEKNVGFQYDRVMFVAKREGDIYNSILGIKKSLIVPLGVSIDYLTQRIKQNKVPYSIAFMGALNVSHNENAILHFANDIFPKVLEKLPDAKLYIIGGEATSSIKKLSSNSIILTGRVEDVRVEMGKCQIFICPLLFGSGIKTKNLEAMAMGIPVVTTSIGAENIEAVDGKDWFIANEDEKFAEYIVRLLNNEILCEQIGCSGQNFVKENFSWDLASNAFSEVFKNEQRNKNFD